MLLREISIERVRLEFQKFYLVNLLLVFMDLQCYGYLLGRIKLIKDNHHDEVFIEKTQLIIMRNNVWLYGESELVAIALEILGDE